MRINVALIFVLFALSPLASAAVLEPDFLNTITRAKFAKELAANLRPFLDPTSYAFVQSKLKGQKPIPIRIEKSGASRLLVTSDTLSFAIEFHEAVEVESYALKINQKEITVLDKMNHEELFQSIVLALPGHEAQFFWPSFIFPQAHAQMGAMLGSALGGALASFLVARAQAGRKSCANVKRWRRQVEHCLVNRLTPSEYSEAGQLLGMRSNPPACGDDRKVLITCLQATPPGAPGAPSGYSGRRL